MNELLALNIGGRTVAENLQDAVDSGTLLQNEDGTFSIPLSDAAISPSISVHKGPYLGCLFLNAFLFKVAYAESCVPFGCKECYKVRVIPKTLRQLMALKSIQEKVECRSKSGVEVDRPMTQNFYSCFFYCIGLDRARKIYKIVREAVNNDPKLGSEIPVCIKRGCTHFEIKCGPSDKYEFRPELPELEKYLDSRFKSTQKISGDEMQKNLSTFNLWIQTSYRIGDDTYLDFTGGKRLYPKSVVYDPDPSNGT